MVVNNGCIISTTHIKGSRKSFWDPVFSEWFEGQDENRDYLEDHDQNQGRRVCSCLIQRHLNRLML